MLVQRLQPLGGFSYRAKHGSVTLFMFVITSVAGEGSAIRWHHRNVACHILSRSFEKGSVILSRSVTLLFSGGSTGLQPVNLRLNVVGFSPCL